MKVVVVVLFVSLLFVLMFIFMIIMGVVIVIAVLIVITVVIMIIVMVVLIMIAVVVVITVLIVITAVVMITVVVMVIVMVVLIMIAVVVVIIVVVITMIVMLENGNVAVRQKHCALCIQKSDRFGFACDVFNHVLQPRGQRRANPKYDIGLLKSACLRRPKRISVGRRARIDQELGGADPIHHLRDQGVDRGDIGNHAGRIGHCSGRKKAENSRG